MHRVFTYVQELHAIKLFAVTDELETSMKSNIETIIEAVCEAFRYVKRPSTSDLVHFPNTGDEIWIESFLGNEETSWCEVAADQIEKESSALTVFSPAAFQYYLPAYMTWVLRNYEISRSNTVNHVLYDLDVTDTSADSHQIWMQRFSRLSKAQGNAVLQFLTFMSQLPDERVNTKAAKRAVDAYWSRYQA